MERGRDGRGGNAKMRYDCGEDGGEGESERSESERCIRIPSAAPSSARMPRLGVIS